MGIFMMNPRVCEDSAPNLSAWQQILVVVRIQCSNGLILQNPYNCEDFSAPIYTQFGAAFRTAPPSLIGCVGCGHSYPINRKKDKKTGKTS
jgi:hypothetical protein